MKNNIYCVAAAGILFSVVLLSCKKENNRSEPQVVSASGDINAAINSFRNLLGATLNTTPGHTSGRREINWDGVPDTFEHQKIPVNFFNPIEPGSNPALQRGFLYSAQTDARISATNFASLEASNATQFAAFSGSKTFSAVSSNLWNVQFAVPGQDAAASVKGFGAVFSDVDIAGSASMEFFSGTTSLGVFKVPVHTNGSHSFLGVYFADKKVTKITIQQGSAVVANGVKDISAGGTNDLVIMDDFLYDEPQGL